MACSFWNWPFLISYLMCSSCFKVASLEWYLLLLRFIQVSWLCGLVPGLTYPDFRWWERESAGLISLVQAFFEDAWRSLILFSLYWTWSSESCPLFRCNLRAWSRLFSAFARKSGAWRTGANSPAEEASFEVHFAAAFDTCSTYLLLSDFEYWQKNYWSLNYSYCDLQRSYYGRISQILQVHLTQWGCLVHLLCIYCFMVFSTSHVEPRTSLPRRRYRILLSCSTNFEQKALLYSDEISTFWSGSRSDHSLGEG